MLLSKRKLALEIISDLFGEIVKVNTAHVCKGSLQRFVKLNIMLYNLDCG